MQMNMRDYDEALALWEVTEGIGLSRADSREAIEMFLDRNPGLSFVVRDGSQLIGTILCGHDGRRGYLYHAVVTPSYRYRGLGRKLIGHCLTALRTVGIQKCHIFVYGENKNGIEFWEKTGWHQRFELIIMSQEIS